MKNMDEKRKGEIALALLKYQFRREGFRLPSDINIKRELDNVAKEVGISQNELKEFTKTFIEEFLNETFGKW